LTPAIARSAGRLEGSASATKAPAVFLYRYETLVGAAQAGGLAGASPNASVWQMKGNWRGPEKTGPSTLWLVTRTSSLLWKDDAVMRCRPLLRPMISASQVPSACWCGVAAVPCPSTARRGLPSATTLTSTSPPLTRSGWSLDTTEIASRPPWSAVA
jgi:hypothetical protein